MPQCAAEQLVFDGDISTGAADDLQRATEIALEMVTRFGMDEKVGQRTYTPAPQPFLGLPTGGHGQAAETTTRRSTSPCATCSAKDLTDRRKSCRRGARIST